MAKTPQARKHTTGLAGEFLVAGELLRRGVMAAVSFGNAKKADVFALHEGRSALLEVKSTSEAKWVLGGRLPEETVSLWVLVYLPADLKQAPEYFILSGAELRAAVAPRHEAYMGRYRAKHGKEFTARGVVSVFRKDVDGHRGAWEKVDRALAIAQ